MAVELRIALLLIGFAVLIALYFFGKSRRSAYRREDDEFNFETNGLSDPLELDPTVEADLGKVRSEIEAEVHEELSDISELVREDIAESPRIKKSTFKHQPSLLDPQKPDIEEIKEEKLVVLHVVARPPQKLKGKGIVNLAEELDLEYDDLRIFHKNIERFSGKQALYSVLNMVKPGTFNLDTMDEFETPGISFVMHLPGPEEGLKAFNIMLEAAKKMGDRLNGDLLDESRSRLSPQTIAHLQEEVQLFSLKYPRRAKD